MPVKIKYKGDRPEVVLAATGEVVKRGDVVEVPRDIADANVASGEWERVVAVKETPSAKAARAKPVTTISEPDPAFAAEPDDEEKG